jgi:hypothetical protein
LERHYRITTADIEAPASGIAKSAPNIGFVVLDPDGDLPMETDSFDVSVSSDVFEHIPKQGRRHWASELDRVARMGQVHTVPADSRDGLWASTDADKAFAAWHKATLGEDERWTNEHLAIGAPYIEELRSIFPEASVSGIVGCDVWQVTSELYRPQADHGPLAVRRDLSIELSSIEQRPPYKNALLVIRR